jgi:choice-of-anchor A domain-containing protein
VAGLDVSMNGFSICLLDQGDTCLAVGGTARLYNGQLYGDLIYQGAAHIGSDVNFAAGGAASYGAAHDYGAVAAELSATSLALAGATANGITSISAWGAVVFTGHDPSQNIFEVDAAELASASYIEINVPHGAVALINVSGSSVSVSGVGINLVGGSTGETLWNFHEATQLTLSAINFQGSVLAPQAEVEFNNGQFNGTMIGDSISGSGQYNLSLFGGSICL